MNMAKNVVCRETDQCAYFLTHKNRYCRMKSRSQDGGYCAEHMAKEKDLLGVVADESDLIRIPCPLDPSHSVYNHLLQKHLKKCNAAKKTVPECFVKGVNSGQADYIPSVEEKTLLGEIDPDLIETVTRKIDIAYNEICEDIKEAFHSHPLLEKEMADDVNGPAACKHLMQQSSIIGHLNKHDLLTNDTVFLEFGAGRGALSHWIQLATRNHDNVHYVLVDRASCRRKMDVKHRYECQGPRFERLLIDIENLELKRLKCINQGAYKKVVGVSKHLCGEATDLALRCLTNYDQHASRNAFTLNDSPCDKQLPSEPSSIEPLPEPDDPSSSTEPVNDSSSTKLLESKQLDRDKNLPTTPQSDSVIQGIVIALCCHQRCKWKSFFGYEEMISLGFTPLDFHIVTHMSSWAVCGVRPSKITTGNPAGSCNATTTSTTTTEAQLDDQSGSHTTTNTQSGSHTSNIDTQPGSHTNSCNTQCGSHTTNIDTQESQSGSQAKDTDSQSGSHTSNTQSGSHTTNIDTQESQSGSASFSPKENSMSIRNNSIGEPSPPAGAINTSLRGYHPHPKEHVGLKCKRLLDYCRVRALRKCGYDVKLVRYTPKDVSLENVLLVATRNSL